MPVEFKHILTFSEMPNATSGVFLPERNMLLTGHENGMVVRWDLSKKTHAVLLRCPSKIETISCSDEGRIVVGSNAGDLLVIDLEDSHEIYPIQKGTFDVHSRVWRTLWPRKEDLIVTSTYGVVNVLHNSGNNVWERIPLSGHSDSVFGLGGLDDKLIASGDYRGKLLIWEREQGQFKRVQTLHTNRAVEDIAWHPDGTFVTIDLSGRISLFEKTGKESNQWQTVFEVDNATSTGNCIHITEDGKTVFAGTDNEVVQFDTDSQQIGTIPIKGTKKIFSVRNEVLVLTKGGFLSFERKEIEVKVKFIKYKYAKVSLIGHTGVGKSTLCNFIITGSQGNVKSTFGKRIWNWKVPSEGPLEERIIFHDHGGQETVLGTFLPFLTDSDIILILFQQNDRHSFDIALKTLEYLRQNLGPETKTFFVQTFIDQEVNDIDEPLVEHLVDEGKTNGYFKLCPSIGEGVEELKTHLQKEISWEKARTMIQSEYADAAMKTILTLQRKDVNVIRFDDLGEVYTKIRGPQVSARHLRFLLKDLSNQGIIYYYPEVSDLVILNDKEYNELLTNVPIFVEKKNGIVPFDELDKTFRHPEYLAILDSVYLNYKISLKNRELRIFPEKLKSGRIRIPEPYNTLLRSLPGPDEKLLNFQRIEIGRLIEALSELNMGCVDASQTEGLFSWGENACVYYSFQDSGDAIRGYKVKCTYFIAGKKDQTCDRLRKEFVSIIESLYGPFLVSQTEENKKKVLKKKTAFDVALSFAGEQRDYAAKVHSILMSKGIKCFYDEFYQAQLWGTNLAEYLHNVYYSQSEYCIMLISKEYIEKAWPTHERRSAIAKQIEQAGVREYILPVVFDDSEVAGLQLSSIGYLDARKDSPEKVANLFLLKIGYEEDS